MHMPQTFIIAFALGVFELRRPEFSAQPIDVSSIRSRHNYHDDGFCLSNQQS